MGGSLAVVYSVLSCAVFVVTFLYVPYVGHLLFSIATTGSILVGIHLEERDLRTFIGPEYDEYRRRVPMLIPIPSKKT